MPAEYISAVNYIVLNGWISNRVSVGTEQEKTAWRLLKHCLDEKTFYDDETGEYVIMSYADLAFMENRFLKIIDDKGLDGIDDIVKMFAVMFSTQNKLTEQEYHKQKDFGRKVDALIAMARA